MDLKSLHKISYGMYIVSSVNDGRMNGQIANTVFQITSEPPQIGVCINKTNLTYEFIDKSKIFAISVLSKETPMNFIGNFGFKSGREIDKFKKAKYKIGQTGTPIVLDNTLAYMECEVVNKVDCGTHVIFIGKVIDAQVIADGEPMTYAYYHEIKHGKSPKTAPTYINEEKQEEVSKMKKYRCKVCGYVYDPDNGDPDSGIKPGTPFEELPDDWVCPVCGADKSNFEEV